MASNKMSPQAKTSDVTMQAKQKSELLYSFFDNIKKGGEILTVEDLDIAIESLKLAQLDIKAQEERRRQEREAELLKQRMEEQEQRRRQAEVRAAKRAERKRKERAKEITALELPLDYTNRFEEDARAHVHCDSIAEGLLVSLDALGLVDIEFISAVTGEEMKTVIETLKGSIYQNPLHWGECYYKGWETADEYLSGNLMHKLAVANEANEEFPGIFDDNIRGLKEVISPELSTDEIYITLGSPWVPTDVIDDFILHMIGIEHDEKAAAPFSDKKYAVRHDDVTGLWEIPEKTRFRRSHEHGKYEHINYHVYGTARMDMLYLLENVLNMKTIAIYDTLDPIAKTRILNQQQTVKILEKQEQMIAEFKKWVWSDEKRKTRLQNAYCRRYGNIKKRVFDGNFLDFPDMNPDIQLRKHQKDAVARIVLSPNTLLAHDVGAGKTYTMIAAGMELRRLGKSQKNLYVIPNNIMTQWVEIFRTMYPSAKLLVVNNRNFCFKKRSETLNRIINEDFDAILMTYSCFDMLSLSKQYYQEFYEEQLKRLDKATTTFYSQADINRKRASVLRVMEKLQTDMSRNVCDIPFDDLGINTLFVDEAHNYKNVPLESGIMHVKGFNKSGSIKCAHMMDKVHCVQRQNNGGRVVLATGTPITNSITDVFVLQKYLQDGELEFLGIQNFDSWVGMFARKTSEFEIDVDTNNYHLATRFSRFHNVPELTSIFSSVADFYHVNDTVGIPELDGYTDSIREGGDDFKDYLKDISVRADDVRQKRVDKTEDNLLKITTDGRKAALDMRLIDMAYGMDTNAKVFRCAENIMDIYHRTREEKSIQMVFCDSSTPKVGFNLYDELKHLLMVMGMPESQIAFIHDADTEAKKRLLFRDLQNGTVSVVIGSTFKMGLGVNVQQRLCALHHLDVPWRPADMVQREGRILRQGNTCEEVQIFRYITRGSFDAYSWQLLESKQRFISQILSGHISVREGEDVDETVLNYAEVKALAVGNPLIKRRVELCNELDKYKILHRDYVEERMKKQKALEELPEKIEKQMHRIENTQADMDYFAKNKTLYKEMEYKEQKAIRDAIYAAAKTHVGKPVEKKILTYQGFDVVVPARMRPKQPLDREGKPIPDREPIPYVFVKRAGVHYMEIESISGITKRLNNLLENLDKRKEKQEKELENLRFNKQVLEDELQKEEPVFLREIEEISREIDIINKELELVS